MRFDVTPSTRAHSAQRMLCATVLTCEAFVALFAGLAAHGLAPETRVASWILALVLMLAYLVTSSRLGKSGAPAYVVGLVLQVGLLAFGIFVPAMVVVGLFFAALYVWGLVKGRSMDLEKDAVDARVLAGKKANG